MITNDQQLQTTRERIAWFQDQVADLRRTEANPVLLTFKIFEACADFLTLDGHGGCRKRRNFGAHRSWSKEWGVGSGERIRSSLSTLHSPLSTLEFVQSCGCGSAALGIIGLLRPVSWPRLTACNWKSGSTSACIRPSWWARPDRNAGGRLVLSKRSLGWRHLLRLGYMRR